MKLIAIRPLAGCHPSYLKNLTEGEFYYIYNNYEIKKDGTLEIKPTIPDDFYRLADPAITISAIVGKNGSGKSTVIELALRAINNISKRQGKLKKLVQLKYVDKLRVELYFETDNFYKAVVHDDDIKVYKYDGRTKKIKTIVTEFKPQDFFYTIGVNYSHYAYNENDMPEEGNWLAGLFHKNDGYQTPIVLNPYREEGNININIENDLIKARLIANLLRTPNTDSLHFKKLTESLLADTLELSLVESLETKELYVIKRKKLPDEVVTIKEIFPGKKREQYLLLLNNKFKFGYKEMNENTKNYFKIAFDYLLYKIVRIALKYYNPTRVTFVMAEKMFSSTEEEHFLYNLALDRSHISLKLRQTLNFIRYREKGLKLIEIKSGVQKFHLNDLAKINSKILEGRSPAELEGIELIPPPIFQTEIMMIRSGNTDSKIPFIKLSSGEKQMIYSVHSIIYHLSNLESVNRTTATRTAYRHINIVLEEIELYAHPEMQRRYVEYIIQSILELNLKKTQGINICFVTHSPFILSDIPDNNILFLNEHALPLDNDERIKTFGGNIHELLSHSFFLDKGTIGAFALKKIQYLIDSVQFKNKKEIQGKTNPQLLGLIEIIGEPFIREKLKDMYYVLYDKQTRIEELEAEIKRLKR